MNQRFEALDAFRGLGALAVVVFHLHLFDSISRIDFFRGSSIFVDFFFVLSGFVLAHGYGFKRNLDFTSFMKARFYRLWPLHFFMLSIFIIFILTKVIVGKLAGITFNHEAFTGNFEVSGILPNLLLIHAWTSFTNASSFNYPSWSISIEFYVYALFALLICFFKKYYIISWLLLSVIAFILLIYHSDVLVAGALRGLGNFFGGAFTYVLYKKISYIKISKVCGGGGELLLLATIILIVQATFESKTIIASIVFMLTVLFFAFEAGVVSNALKAKPFQYIGKLSYSIYMTHAFVLTLLGMTAALYQKITGTGVFVISGATTCLTFGSNFVNNIVLAVVLVLVLVISSVTYKYVEVYGQKLNKQRVK